MHSLVIGDILEPNGQDREGLVTSCGVTVLGYSQPIPELDGTCPRGHTGD